MSVSFAAEGRRLRIGFFISSLHAGGAEFVVRQWTRELVRTGHDVCVYTYAPGGDNARLAEGARHEHFTPRSRSARVFGLPFWLRKRAKRDELDVIVSLLTFSNLAAIVGLKALPSRVPVVISERNVLSVLLPLNERHPRLKRDLARLLYPRANAVVAISHPVAAELVARYGVRSARTFVVPNPVLETAARRRNGRAPELPRRLHVAFVGRLVRQKSPQLFIETMVELRERGIDVRASMIGDGPLREELESYASVRAIDVAFLGWRQPWWESVANVDCLLLPSESEGFGNVLVEAASVGIPSVARSSALGVADAIVPGLTGELVTGGTVADLADGVIRAVRPAGETALERWLERFRADTSIERLVTALEYASRGQRSRRRALADG
jgi:glycosyltransferase involved in cell wall biosynthesis